jgi:hypothetical protein
MESNDRSLDAICEKSDSGSKSEVDLLTPSETDASDTEPTPNQHPKGASSIDLLYNRLSVFNKDLDKNITQFSLINFNTSNWMNLNQDAEGQPCPNQATSESMGIDLELELKRKIIDRLLNKQKTLEEENMSLKLDAEKSKFSN